MFLVRRLASLQPSTLLKSRALHTHFSLLLLMFLNVSDILHNTCNNMSQLFFKELENHKTIFIWKQSLAGVSFKYVFFKIKFIRISTLQTVHFRAFISVKHLSMQCCCNKICRLIFSFSSFFYMAFFRNKSPKSVASSVNLEQFKS